MSGVLFCRVTTTQQSCASLLVLMSGVFFCRVTTTHQEGFLPLGSLSEVLILPVPTSLGSVTITWSFLVFYTFRMSEVLICRVTRQFGVWVSSKRFFLKTHTRTQFSAWGCWFLVWLQPKKDNSFSISDCRRCWFLPVPNALGSVTTTNSCVPFSISALSEVLIFTCPQRVGECDYNVKHFNFYNLGIVGGANLSCDYNGVYCVKNLTVIVWGANLSCDYN
jgi:hypothetical protein